MNILIPDTCSLINLQGAYVGKTHIIDMLDNLFEVEVSTEIPVEVRRCRLKFGVYRQEILKFVRQSRRRFYRQRDYENILFNQFSPGGNDSRNRGERLNCALALYQVRRRISGQVILLTDDRNALRGLVGWYEKRFKTATIWLSLDLLLYIYLLEFPKWPLVQAQVSLRTVNANMGGNQVEMVKRLRAYRRYLQELHDMLRLMPKVRGVR